jgi:hypothetical protein
MILPQVSGTILPTVVIDISYVSYATSVAHSSVSL